MIRRSYYTITVYIFYSDIDRVYSLRISRANEAEKREQKERERERVAASEQIRRLGINRYYSFHLACPS